MFKKELMRKQREEQEATAHAFQEFIRTFQDTSAPPNKTFVRSGILNSKTGQEIATDRGQIYSPQPFLRRTSSATIKNAIECARLLKVGKLDRPKGLDKPKSNLELLKEELKLRHLERSERNKMKDELVLAGTDSADPTTTNLFIANINPKITEHDLMLLFGAYGPLASVKIMWPRCEDAKTSNCGFVAFMSRSDGERAMQKLKNREDMRIGWGKPIELPADPVYVPPELLKLSLPPPYTGLPFNAQPLKQPFKYPANEQEMGELLSNSIVKVTIPLDKRVLMMVHRVIEFVIREGPLFEAMIMNREINNPTYQFIFDNASPVHVYYRWKLYSLLNGETQKTWSTQSFRMFKNGSIWCPPTIPNYCKGMPEHLIQSNPKVDKALLSDAQKNRFIQIIQTLDLSKKKIGEAMVFCLNHVDAVRDVVDIMIDSFMNDSTKAPKKVARLYLLSDVLYNSGVKKCFAPIYRLELERHLVRVFKRLHKTFKALNADADRNLFKQKTLATLKAWSIWKIYPTAFLNNLENAFLGVNHDSDEDEPLDGANLVGRSGKNSRAVLEKNSDVKLLSAKEETALSDFIPSKWEAVDLQAENEVMLNTKSGVKIEQGTHERKKRKQYAYNREMLRKVEVKVMKYQDDLESGKRQLNQEKSIEKELDSYRIRLLKKFKKETCDSKNKSARISLDEFSTTTLNKEANKTKHKRLKRHLYKDKEKQRDRK